MQGKIFVNSYLIKEKHLDSFQHVNNATYLNILEEIRWDIIEQAGYGLKKIHQDMQGPIILDVNIQFRRELKNRDEVEIHSQCTEIKNKIMSFEQKIYKKDNSIACEALFHIALFDMKERKIIAPSEAWLKAIGL